MSTGQGVEISGSAESQSVELSCSGDMLSTGTTGLRVRKPIDVKAGFATKLNDGEGYVYVARSGQHYKIGKTVNPADRNHQLSIQLPHALETEFLFFCRDYSSLERDLHRHFSASRANGEWFSLSDADLEWFEGLPSRLDMARCFHAKTPKQLYAEFVALINSLNQKDITEFALCQVVQVSCCAATGATHEMVSELQDVHEQMYGTRSPVKLKT